MEKHSKLKDLKLIFDLSSIQSIELDKAIIEKFYEDHKKNKEMGRGYNYAVVEGAGPIGLYTTFKLFIEGISVTLVNDRSADYTREQFILLDRKWVYQLNLILGTQFVQLFNEENSMGKLLDTHVGIVIMKNFETALMNRLKSLALYVEEGEENQQGENSFVKLIYETEVLSINLDYEKPLAVIGTPMRHAKAIIEKYNRKIVNIMKRYNINLDDARERIIFKKTKDIKNTLGEDYIYARKLAKLQINGNGFENEYIKELPLNTYFGKNFLGIPFYLFFCAGGANDRIRVNFLEEPQVLTETKNYGSILIDKADHNLRVTGSEYTYINKPMTKMGIHLISEGIYQFIANSYISYQLKMRYDNIINIMLYGTMGYGSQELILNVFELKQRITIALITPLALAYFIRDVKMEMNVNPNMREYYVNFIRELENKWATAVFKYLASLYNHDTNKVIIKTEENQEEGEDDDQHHFKLFSSTTFWVNIRGVTNPSKRYRTEDDSAIVAAVGDANTSAHFFTGSGLSTGKLF
uniref:Uncharacterized protein n=1 Tax=Meloidogyne javanica TaxID=6303 RepID=A0A915M8M0_MELJA